MNIQALKYSRTLTIPKVCLFEMFDACPVPDMCLVSGFAVSVRGFLPSGFPGLWGVQMVTWKWAGAGGTRIRTARQDRTLEEHILKELHQRDVCLE